MAVDRARQRKRRREMARAADLSTIGLVFPTAMIIGYFLGRFFGGLFDAVETGGLIGGGVGLVSGFYNVYKVALKLGNDPASDRPETLEPPPDRRVD